MTDFEGFDTEEWTTTNFVYPTCRLVTSAVNMVKSSNAKMNGDELIDLLGLEVAGHVGDVHWDTLFHPQATGTIAHHYLGYSIHLNGQINHPMPVYGVSLR